ncbi:MAG: GFA family protein [Formosimonas sp.]
MTPQTGRCLCGNVQFSISSAPLAARICWCRTCQHISANGTFNIMVALDGLTVTGELAEYQLTADSGNQNTRQFCATCGTQMFSRSSARPNFRVIRAGNLDNPSAFAPSMNIWTASAPTWACLDESLEQVAGQPMPPQTVLNP